MDKKNFKKIIKIEVKFDKLFSFLSDKPLTAFFLVAIFCILIGLSIFYVYVFLPLRRDSPHGFLDFDLNNKYYGEVQSMLIDREFEFELLKSLNERDIFSPFSVVEIMKKNEIVKQEENNNSLLNEDKEDDFREENNFLDKEKITEALLIKTLFEFYILEEKDMPSISERSLIWENLGLGKAEEYKGLYYQNVIFLEALKR